MKYFRINICVFAFVCSAFVLFFALYSKCESNNWKFDELKLLATGFKTPEGPTLDREGNLYIVEYETNNVIKITKDGNVSTYIQVGIQNNGLIRDAKGMKNLTVFFLRMPVNITL